MRHVYLTLQESDVVTELLCGDHRAIREPFRALLAPRAVSWLADDGAATFNSYQAYARRRPPGHAFADPDPPRDLPFVPFLGPLRLNVKAQVEHRAYWHFRGFTTWELQSRPSSPTGTRLIPHREELVSEYRLADTFTSTGPDQTRRMHTEGATDSFISDDESTWHVAFSIEPRQRIEVLPLSDEAENALGAVRVRPRAYVHLYPHGGVTATLGLSVLFEEDRRIADVIPTLRMLTGRRTAAQFAFGMRGVDALPAAGFLRRLIDMTTTAVSPDAFTGKNSTPVYALALSAGPADLSDAELSGLLTLDDRYELLRDRWVEARASLYGKYVGDRVVASAGSLAVATSPEHFPPSGRRRFFWRCHAIKEFAALQTHMLHSISQRLAASGTASGPDEATVQRLMMIGEHLIEFHRGLPAHHRKWFYECERLAGGPSAKGHFFDVLAELHHNARHAAMMRRMDEEPRIRINVSDSQIGTLNLGTIIGDVENHLSAVHEADEARDALQGLAQQIVATEGLDDDRRRELLEHVDLLAEEAAKAPEKRRSSLTRGALSALASASAVVGDLSSVWATAGPILIDFFGG
jgi:hypothetical protein